MDDVEQRISIVMDLFALNIRFQFEPHHLTLFTKDLVIWENVLRMLVPLRLSRMVSSMATVRHSRESSGRWKKKRKTQWHADLEEDVEHPTVSLALICRRFGSRHFGLPVSLACHYREMKKSWKDAVSVCTLPSHKLFWQQILQKIAEVIPG